MAKNTYTYAVIMAMKESDFTTLATSKDKDWLDAATERVEPRKVYPRMAVWSEEKSKMVYLADKSKKPTIKMSPISFFSLKKAFCEEVLKIAPVENKKQTFRDRMKLAAKA